MTFSGHKKQRARPGEGSTRFHVARTEAGRRPAERPVDVSLPALHFGAREVKKETEGPVGGEKEASVRPPVAAVHTHTNTHGQDLCELIGPTDSTLRAFVQWVHGEEMTRK